MNEEQKKLEVMNALKNRRFCLADLYETMLIGNEHIEGNGVKSVKADVAENKRRQQDETLLMNGF